MPTTTASQGLNGAVIIPGGTAARIDKPVAPGADGDTRTSREFSLRVAASQGYSVDMAELLRTAWSMIHPDSLRYGDELRIAIHEAFSNALLHGCLEVDGFEVRSVENLRWQEELVQHRLVEPCYADRTIAIRLTDNGPATTVAVEHDGPGFTPPEDWVAFIEARPGRGLHIIHTLADSISVEQDGRRIVFEIAGRSRE